MLKKVLGKVKKILALYLVYLMIFQGNVLVTLADVISSFTISIVDEDNNAITQSGVEVTLNDGNGQTSTQTTDANGVATFTDFVEEETNYSVTVNNATGYVLPNNPYMLSVSTGDIGTSVGMEKQTYSAVVSVTGTCSINAEINSVVSDVNSNSFTFKHNDSVRVIIPVATIDDGYELVEFIDNGVSTDVAASKDGDRYIFILGENVNHNISIKISPKKFNVFVADGIQHGAIKINGQDVPAEGKKIEYDGNNVITIIPDDGYNLVDVFFDGTTVPSGNYVDDSNQVNPQIQIYNSDLRDGLTISATFEEYPTVPFEDSTMDGKFDPSQAYTSSISTDNYTYYINNDRVIKFDAGYLSKFKFSGSGDNFPNGTVSNYNFSSNATITGITYYSYSNYWEGTDISLGGKTIRIIKDNEKPTVDKINDSTSGTVLVKTKASEVTVTGQTEATDVKYIIISESNTINVDAVNNAEASGVGWEKAELNQDGSFSFSKTFTEIDGDTVKAVEDGNFEYYIFAIDKAGNKSDAKMVKIIIDNTAPTIGTFEFSVVNPNENPALTVANHGTYYNGKVTIRVTASDKNGSKDGSGVSKIVLYVDEEEYSYVDLTQSAESENQSKTATFTLPASDILNGNLYLNADISAVAYDENGNVTERITVDENNSNVKAAKLMIETIKPAIGITPAEGTNSYCDTLTTEEGEVSRYFVNGEAPLFTINVSDTVNGENNNSGIRRVEISVQVNGQNYEYTQDENGKEISDDFSNENKINELEFIINPTKYKTSEEDYEFLINVKVVDSACNVADSQQLVYIDNKAPTITGIKFEGNEKDGFLSVEQTPYGYFFKEETRVKIFAEDEAVSSGIRDISYYLYDVTKNQAGEIVAVTDLHRENNTDADKDSADITITVPAGFKGQIYATASDNLENRESYVSPKGVITETEKMHNSSNHISMTRPASGKKDSKGNDLFNAGVSVDIEVVDGWSGIKDISWTITAPNDGNVKQSGRVEVGHNKDLSGDSSGWTITKSDSNLVTGMKKTIRVDANSNDIELVLKMTDNAGNTSEKKDTFSIDKVAPVIKINFDNSVADSTYNDIYKTDRTATITVTERNFNAADVVYKITNTDGVLPSVNLNNSNVWTEHRDSANPDSSTYTAVVQFTTDGDYTFDAVCADMAGNMSTAVAAPTFTIDKTVPVVEVSYNNNNSMNGNYFGDTRTATITVTEHNFDPGRINIIGTATDNGNVIQFPSVSGWSDNGDTHVATLSYAADGYYTFDIEGLDKAGNELTDYTPDEFCVDLTAPVITISGIEDCTAYNGAVIPVIEYTDTNPDVGTFTISLTGVHNGEVFYEGTYENIPNGRRFTYNDFTMLPSVDDIYTLSISAIDMAGHEAVENTSIRFSVNRFGSVYTFDNPKPESILGQYLREEQDIVITETNVSVLDRESILLKMMKNGVPTDLVENDDYTISAVEDDGQWSQYTYTVKSKLFTDDGIYSITVYSVDEAANVNENIDESKYFDKEKDLKAEVFFAIDKTAPVIVPINVESEENYREENKNIQIEIKDNMLLEAVQIYLNNKEVEYSVEGESYAFSVPESTNRQSIMVVANDAAGNKTEINIADILVTTSAFALWLNNTPLVICTILGAGALITGVSGTVVFAKRRRRK